MYASYDTLGNSDCAICSFMKRFFSTQLHDVWFFGKDPAHRPFAQVPQFCDFSNRIMPLKAILHVGRWFLSCRIDFLDAISETILGAPCLSKMKLCTPPHPINSRNRSG